MTVEALKISLIKQIANIEDEAILIQLSVDVNDLLNKKVYPSYIEEALEISLNQARDGNVVDHGAAVEKLMRWK
jgi:hypothetical protein